MARPRKPSHLKAVQGTTRKARENPAEPSPARAMPEPPGHISPRGRAAWGRLARLLDRMGVLTEADGMALERLAEVYADVLEARDGLARPVYWQEPTGERDALGNPVTRTVRIAEPGSPTYVTSGPSGPVIRKRPEVAQAADAERRFLTYLSAFGLTPATRSRVSAISIPLDPKDVYFTSVVESLGDGKDISR